MSEGAKYESTPEEFLIVGILGTIMYVSLGTIIAISFKRGNRNEMTYYFFISMSIMCLLELPRFMAMLVTRDYTSKVGYIFHLLASSAFFAGFSCVCYQWKGLLRLGTYSTLVYSAQGIVVSNGIFGGIELLAIIMCALAGSLDEYFSSYSFEIFTFVDAFKNVVFAGFLTYYGLKLIARFWSFRNADAAGSNSKSVFSVALHRLTVALTVATVCFVIRVTMLFLKMVALHSETVITNNRFRLFGLFWFILADFIPRGLPSLAFVALMMYSRRDTNADLNKEFLKPISTSQEMQDKVFGEYNMDDSSRGDLPDGHFTFLGDGHSPRAGDYEFYDGLSYYEEDEDMEANDQTHMDALGYKSPRSRNSPGRDRLLSHTEV